MPPPHPINHPNALPQLLTTVHQSLLHILQTAPNRNILPTQETLSHAVQSLPAHLPPQGLGLTQTTQHLLDDIAPAVSSSSLSSRYFGFVTGGTTPAARLADYLVTTLDECLAVRIPADTVATDVEQRALTMLAELLQLDPDVWTGGFTPGSSNSNLYGIACGREHVLRVRGAPSPAAVGIQSACDAAGIHRIQIFASMAHPSIMKAASLTGLGRAAVTQIGRPDAPWHLDLARLQRDIQRPDRASIVSVSLGEVNTGKLGVTADELRQLRQLCDRHRAWLHIDAAFGMFINALPDTPDFDALKSIAQGIALADSITGDGHKLLNVPFDCGFFYVRDASRLKDVFSIPKADFAQFAIPSVYFSRPIPANGPSNPTDMGIQNGRRFRALPVYASLTAYGRAGYEDMLVRQTRLARGIAAYVWDHPAYELLPRMPGSPDKQAVIESVFVLVLFGAVDPVLNETLLVRINETGKMYAQGVVWQGRRAVRCAVANWAVDPEADLQVVTGVLAEVAEKWQSKARL